MSASGASEKSQSGTTFEPQTDSTCALVCPTVNTLAPLAPKTWIGPADVYRLHLLSEHGGPVASNGAVTIATMPLASLDPGAVDTLLFSGGEDDAVLQASANPAMQDWLLRAAQKIRRVGSICSGALALALARLGLLDGKRATTHWSACEKMAALFPSVKVAPDAVHVEDGRMWTSVGVTTGIDMTLQMVADDVGESIANVIAKRLVIATRRPGYQAQVSAVIAAHEKPDPDFSALLAWLQARLSDQVDVAAMAAQVAMSPRTFHHKFTARFGQTPARFVETLRLEHAQSLLRSGLSMKFIARQCGYNDFSQFAKAYQRRFGVSPAMFRQGMASA